MNEQQERKRIYKGRLIRAGILLLFALFCFLAAGIIPKWLMDLGCPESGANLVHYLLRGGHIFGAIIGVMKFSSAMHAPLTKKEAEELAERERIEKTEY